VGADRLGFVASSGGSPSHPDWYYNLKANPVITAEVGARTVTVVAEELDDTARAELWPTLVARFPTVGKYQAATARRIPVLLLTGTERE
jgi:deazaflavin-dependent oxidoreductase (nitroreductase family)